VRHPRQPSSAGCGKSTLLDILADRKPGAPPEGTILVNGEKIGPSYRRVAAYVMQSDVLFPRLTVRETLMYAAQLRVPASVPLAEKTARVRPRAPALHASARWQRRPHFLFATDAMPRVAPRRWTKFCGTWSWRTLRTR